LTKYSSFFLEPCLPIKLLSSENTVPMSSSLSSSTPPTPSTPTLSTSCHHHRHHRDDEGRQREQDCCRCCFVDDDDDQQQQQQTQASSSSPSSSDSSDRRAVGVDEMSRLLDDALLSRRCRRDRCESESSLSVPVLYGGTWTPELRDKLDKALFFLLDEDEDQGGDDRDGASSSSSTAARCPPWTKVRFRLQAVPPTACFGCDDTSASTTAASTTPRRREVWNSWRQFLRSSRALTDLEAVDLTDFELLQLAGIVADRCDNNNYDDSNTSCTTQQLRTVRLEGHSATLGTLRRLVDLLPRYHPRLRVTLKFSLALGEEYDAKGLSELTDAVERNYVVERFEIDKSEYSDLMTMTTGAATTADYDAAYRKAVRTIECVAALNRSGRRYVVQYPNDVSRGVGVLSGVVDDVDCLFRHLREKPSLLMLLPPRLVVGRKEDIAADQGRKRKSASDRHLICPSNECCVE